MLNPRRGNDFIVSSPLYVKDKLCHTYVDKLSAL